MTCGIYLITCLPTEEKYVGRSNSIESRWQAHIRDMEKGKHSSNRMQTAWNEYGITAFSFQILEVCAYEDTYGKEIQWHSKLSATLTGNPEDKKTRRQKTSENSRLFWEWVRHKGGKNTKDASRISSEFRDEWLEYKEANS